MSKRFNTTTTTTVDEGSVSELSVSFPNCPGTGFYCGTNGLHIVDDYNEVMSFGVDAAHAQKRIKLIDGTAATPALTFDNAQTTGVFNSGGNAVGLTAGGVENVTVNSGSIELNACTEVAYNAGNPQIELARSDGSLNLDMAVDAANDFKITNSSGNADIILEGNGSLSGVVVRPLFTTQTGVKFRVQVGDGASAYTEIMDLDESALQVVPATSFSATVTAADTVTIAKDSAPTLRLEGVNGAQDHHASVFVQTGSTASALVLKNETTETLTETSNMFEWQLPAGTTLMRINKEGSLQASSNNPAYPTYASTLDTDSGVLVGSGLVGTIVGGDLMTRTVTQKTEILNDLQNRNGSVLEWESADLSSIAIGDGVNNFTGITGSGHYLTTAFVADATDWVNGYISVSWTGKGTASGDIFITASFPDLDAQSGVPCVHGSVSGITIAGSGHMVCEVDLESTTTVIRFLEYASGSTSALTQTAFSTSGSVNITFSYPTVERVSA